MQLVPAVTELMVAELLYLEKQGASLPIEMLINSSGTTRQDGEIVSGSSQMQQGSVLEVQHPPMQCIWPMVSRLLEGRRTCSLSR
jgi:hypothetical protein